MSVELRSAHRSVVARLLLPAVALVLVAGVVGAAPAEAADATLDLSITPTAVAFGTPVTATATFEVNGAPQAGTTIHVVEDGVELGAGVTGSDGTVAVEVVARSAPTATISAAVDPASPYAGTASSAVAVDVAPATAVVAFAAPVLATSERAFLSQAQVSDLDGHPLPGVRVTLHVLRFRATADVAVGTVTAGADGVAMLYTSLWKTGQVWASVAETPFTHVARSTAATVSVRASRPAVAMPRGAPQPRVRYPDAPAALGSGAHAVISRLPGDVWARMQGRTWHSGCMARTSLRYITVNYWGFDGFRYRGELVMRATAAARTAQAFTRLYALRYAIRLMVTEDRYGKNPKGPGANDYASMAADNTSGFNCRWVVGREASRAPSPHASGGSVDVNPWENPDRTGVGTYPNAWWFPRNRRSSVVLTPTSAAVHVFTHLGFMWLKGSDWQHFQLGRRASAG